MRSLHTSAQLMRLGKDYIRLRMLAIPVSGLIFSLATLVPGLLIDPASDPNGFARAAVTPAYLVANLAGLLGVVVLLFGFQALYDYLSDTSMGSWAFAGMVSSTAGMGLLLPFLGILTFAAPEAGRLYLSGVKDAMTAVASSVSPTSPASLLFGGLSVLLFVLGSAIFAGCIWRSGKLPKWSAVPYAVAPLFTIPLYKFAVAFLGSVMLMISGVWLAISLWRKT